jgi:cation diffusion facilitator CzcD-associated flavoprotein CzcO
MKFTPYWLDTAPQGLERSRTMVSGHADVAVLGPGLTGLSSALHLARKGAKVAVLEKETVAWGASGRNGGMATPGLAIGFRDAIAKYGFPTASVRAAVVPSVRGRALQGPGPDQVGPVKEGDPPRAVFREPKDESRTERPIRRNNSCHSLDAAGRHVPSAIGSLGESGSVWS